jgi:hypothetical protein
MRKYINSFSIKFISIVIFSVVILTGQAVFAQGAGDQGEGQALEIGPPVISRSVDPGSSLELSISLRNVSQNTLVVKSQINDFIAGGEDGTPKLLLEDGESSPFSIIKWVAPLSDLTLEPKELADLRVKVTVPANASPGGYFGIVRFTATAPELQDTGVSLSASLGSLIFIGVSGEANEELSLESFETINPSNTGSLFEYTPVEFAVRLKNTGNIYEQPTGKITITDMFDNKVGVVNVNLAKNNILPQSTRKFDQLLLDNTVIGDKMLFGKYTADLKITYGADNKELSSTLTFWVIPYKLIAIIIVLLIMLFIGLRYAIKRYNKHIINQHSKAKK